MNKYLVEFLGTMFLMFTIFATGNWLAIGAALAIAVLLGGVVSGGAFNPAVAISLYAAGKLAKSDVCLLYTSPSPRDRQKSRMPSSA